MIAAHRRLSLGLAALCLLPLAACRKSGPPDGEGGPPMATWESSAQGQATIPPVPTSADGLPASIDVSTLVKLQDEGDVLVLDVREPAEYEEAHIPGVVSMPVAEVPDRLAEIPRDRTVILTCRTGARSDQAMTYLRGQGYTEVHNLKGGILAWQREGQPTESGAP